MEKLDELRTDERDVLTLVCVHPDCPEGRHAFFVVPVPSGAEKLAERPGRLWSAATCANCKEQIHRAAGDISDLGWRTVIDGETVGNICPAVLGNGRHSPVPVVSALDAGL